MRRYLTFVAALLFLLLLFLGRPKGQDFGASQPFLAQSVVAAGPTTPASLGAAAWWESSITNNGVVGYSTNGGVAIWANLTSAGAFYNLTNQTEARFPITRAGLNGISALGFAATPLQYLQNTNFYTVNNTQEIFFVWAVTNTSASLGYQSFTTPASNHAILLGGGLVQVRQGPNSAIMVGAATQNKFYIFDLLMMGENATGYTNGVQTAITTYGNPTNMSGIILGNTHSISVLSMFVWTNRILTPPERSSAYWYCTNRFGVMP